jgi:hypothetical protein
MFSAQPPLRIDSFEAEGSSAAKKRFLNRVGKCLLFSVLKIFSLLEAFLSIASRRPSYKDAAFIQRRWSLHSTTMEPPLSLKEDDILIEMEFSSLFCPHFPPLERLFRLLFHEFQLSRLFTFCQRFSSLILIRFDLGYPAVGGRHWRRPLQSIRFAIGRIRGRIIRKSACFNPSYEHNVTLLIK